MQRLNELTRVQKLGYPTSFTRICCLISVSLPASLAESQRESSVNRRRGILYPGQRVESYEWNLNRGREGEDLLRERFLAWSATCFVTLEIQIRFSCAIELILLLSLNVVSLKYTPLVSFHRLILQNIRFSLRLIFYWWWILEREESVSISLFVDPIQLSPLIVP